MKQPARTPGSGEEGCEASERTAWILECKKRNTHKGLADLVLTWSACLGPRAGGLGSALEEIWGPCRDAKCTEQDGSGSV